MPAVDANMLVDMRTTVRIDDDLYRRVKARAAVDGRTVASVLEDAVRVGMRDEGSTPRRPVERLTTAGAGGSGPKIDVTWFGTALGALDTGVPIAERR